VCNNNHAHDEVTITYATGTNGLVFDLINSNTAYRVHNGGDRTFTAVHIPAFHRADADNPYLPVMEIGNSTNSSADNAFGGTYVSSVTTANETLTTVTFAEEIQLTAIGNNAFTYCSNLASITLPDSVTSIGSGAFAYCTSLTGITIPASVTSLGDQSAFIQCTSLTTVTFAEGSQLTTISIGTFSNCTSLTSITIPVSVTTIQAGAFANCDSLASITIPDSVTSIGQQAFQNCTGLASINIPEGVTAIGTNAFRDCTSLRNITIDTDKLTFTTTSNLGTIFPADNLSVTFKKNPADYAFISSNTRLTNVTLEEGVTSIGVNAFSFCTGLTSITIPASVTSLGDRAFRGCTNLASVTFEGTIPSSGFNDDYNYPVFQGDLRDKFYATNTTNGTPGTYIVTSGTGDYKVWTKQ
jgi:hypothetical protein